ncbi:hypothetical protein B566_EDAN014096, partial [Ephemera danica]
MSPLLLKLVLVAMTARAISNYLNSASFPRVSVEQGTLIGLEMKSSRSKKFFSFQGVPYAAPPVGDLRFRPPQEAAHWEGEKLAWREGNDCAQIHFLFHEYTGHEDCLYLNVYTPRLQRKGSKGLDVMVWIHGGGYFSGSGSTEVYGPEYIMDHEVVLVTINYRVGALGFLNLGTSEASGNYGLKDQVAAFRWVQKNIAKFGGNPRSVTAFGHSAGGIEKIQLAYFAPSIEPPGTVGAILTDDPRDIVARGKINCVPLMVGHTTREGLMALGSKSTTKLLKITKADRYSIAVLQEKGLNASFDLDNNPKHFVPSRFGLAEDSPEFATVLNKIHDFYNRLEPSDVTERYVVMVTDVDFAAGVDELVRGMAAVCPEPVYLYTFSYEGELSLLKNAYSLKRD